MTAWQGVSRAETQKAFDAAVAAYNEVFDINGITEDHALYELHQSALGEALQAFRGCAMGDAELVGEYELKLRQQLEGRCGMHDETRYEFHVCQLAAGTCRTCC